MSGLGTSSEEADAMLERLLEHTRGRLGRLPTRREMLRWAKVYRKVARALERRARAEERPVLGAGAGAHG